MLQQLNHRLKNNHNNKYSNSLSSKYKYSSKWTSKLISINSMLNINNSVVMLIHYKIGLMPIIYYLRMVKILNLKLIQLIHMQICITSNVNRFRRSRNYNMLELYLMDNNPNNKVVMMDTQIMLTDSHILEGSYNIRFLNNIFLVIIYQIIS